MMTPPSPPSPPTPDWIREQRWEEERLRREEIERMNLFIKLVVESIKLPPNKERIINFLVSLLQSDLDIDKRYNIAQKINTIKSQHDDLLTFTTFLKKDILDPSGRLYNALNDQRSAIPITLFGAKHNFSWNYSRSLQKAHQILEREGNKNENSQVPDRNNNARRSF